MQIKGGEFRKRISALSPGTKILVIPHFSYIPDQILEKKKKKKINFQAKIWPFLRVPHSQNMTTYSNFFTWPNVFGFILAIAKISFKNLYLFWSYLK